MLSVEDIMTREPYTLGPDARLADALQLMTEHHIRHIPVLSGDGALIGLVSHRDTLAAGVSPSSTPLTELMSSPVHTTDPQASLRGTALFLHQHRIGCLPVLEGDNLVGIVTDTDFVAVAINLMEQLEMAEPVEQDEFDEGVDDLNDI